MGITAPATFNGTVTFTATAATGGATVQVPITVNVTPAPTLVSTNCPGQTRAGGVTTGLPCVAPSGYDSGQRGCLHRSHRHCTARWL